jgi:LmbE family N-acetylglucosaminyl deacetylase
MPAEIPVKHHTRLLGLFAHPDDETFCAGGTLAKYVAAGAEVMVVSFTRGEAGQIRDTDVATRRTLGQVRATEMQVACERLGVQHLECLDFGDGQLDQLDPQLITAETVEMIRTFRPEVVLTAGEDGAYAHPDHRVVRQAVTEACRLAGAAENFPEQIDAGLVPHAPARLYYSHFARSRTLKIKAVIDWLKGLDKTFRSAPDFAQAFLLFSQETATLRFKSHLIDVGWYPPGFHIVEQGDVATAFYLILSGRVTATIEDEAGRLAETRELGPGDFFGEPGVPNGAHVIAAESTTCLVLGCGDAAPRAKVEEAPDDLRDCPPGIDADATTCIDCAGQVAQKVAAVAAYRSQYPFKPDIFPEAMLREMFGREYFVRVLPDRQWETELLPGIDGTLA